MNEYEYKITYFSEYGRYLNSERYVIAAKDEEYASSDAHDYADNQLETAYDDGTEYEIELTDVH